MIIHPLSASFPKNEVTQIPSAFGVVNFWGVCAMWVFVVARTMNLVHHIDYEDVGSFLRVVS